MYEDLLLRVASQVDDDDQKAIQKAMQLVFDLVQKMLCTFIDP